MQKARSYIYTTALPQPVAAASRKALEIAQRESWRRDRVLALTARFRAGAEQLGVRVLGTGAAGGTAQHATAVLTPIQPVIVGTAAAALRAQQELLSRRLLRRRDTPADRPARKCTTPRDAFRCPHRGAS